MASQAQINYISRRAAQYGLDPRAVLAIAHHEGLGGGIGDNGTSFGPWQLHYGGAYPSSAPRGAQASQAWAWSPQGIDYALRQMASVAGGLKGQAAVEAISRRFERPANPGAEIADAMSVYGGQPGTGAPGGGSPSGGVPTGGRGQVAGLAGMLSQPDQRQHIVTNRLTTLGSALSARLFQNAQELMGGQQPTGLKDLFVLAKGFQQARGQARKQPPLGGTMLAQAAGRANVPVQPLPFNGQQANVAPLPSYRLGQQLSVKQL